MSSWARKLFDGGIKLLSASGHAYASDPHSRVHQGVMHHCSSIDSALEDDANLDMMITTPVDDYINMIVEAAAGGFSELRLYEDVIATGGMPETVFNLKRTSSRVWGGDMVINPTVSDLGTLLSAQVMPGGSRNQSVGGSVAFDLEWICRAGTSYLVWLINRSGGTIIASIGCNHYSSAQIPDVSL